MKYQKALSVTSAGQQGGSDWLVNRRLDQWFDPHFAIKHIQNAAKLPNTNSDSFKRAYSFATK